MTRFRRLVAIVPWDLAGASTRLDETTAEMTLYPTSQRRTFAAPLKRPRSAENARGPTGEDPSDAAHHRA